MISYASNFEDVLLERAFRERHSGFYVDVGAGDPTLGSVTRHFYDRGWSGVNVEPGLLFASLARERPRDVNLNVTIGASGALALASILSEYARGREIDFLRIEAGGSECHIVASHDWRSHRPKVLAIRSTAPGSNRLSNGDWEPVVLGKEYIRASFDGISCFYVAAEHRGLADAFVVPVNRLDDFVHYDPRLAELTAERDFLLANQAKLISQLADDLRARSSGLASLIRRLRGEKLPISELEATAKELRRLVQALVATSSH